MLVEVNPLSVNDQGDLIALDGKVTVDDSGVRRLPDMQEYEKLAPKEPLVQEAEGFNFLLIPCNQEGNIGIMSNGSGMLMSCMDALAKRGMVTHTTLDLGGGATAERIKEAVRILLSDEKIEYLFTLIVEQGVTLNVEAGAKLHFHDGAYLKVYGTLKCNGTAQ